MICSSAILPTIVHQVRRINKHADEHGLNDHSPRNWKPIELTLVEKKLETRDIRNCILAIIGIPLAALVAAFIAALLA